MNTLVDFNAAKHTLKHGQKKVDPSKWMSLKDIAESLNLTVPKAKELIQRAVASRMVKNMTQHGPKGMQILYAVEMVNEIRKLYTTGALTGRSRFFRFLPAIGHAITAYSVGRILVQSKFGKAIIAKFEIEKWEQKAEHVVDTLESKYRPLVQSKIAAVESKVGALPKNWHEARQLAMETAGHLFERRHRSDAKSSPLKTGKSETVAHA